MGATTIEWTDVTWNPVAGCTVVSPGCTNCYAMRMAARLDAMGQAKYRDLTSRDGARRVWTGAVRCDETSLEIPLRWRKPRLVFVNSMSDLFHEGVPKAFIQQVWATMEAARWHTFQILTKRPERMRLLADQLQLLPNVWLGTSVENTDCLWRLRELQATRAAVRFASFEPLLGPVDHANLEGIDWAVVGGESGPGRGCPRSTGYAQFAIDVKRTGSRSFSSNGAEPRKKESGRQLDGRTWDDKPEAYRAHRPEPGRANGQEQTIGNIGTTIQMASR